MEQLWERDWRVTVQANRRKHWGYFSYMKSSTFTKMHELGNTARNSVVTLLLFLRLALLVALFCLSAPFGFFFCLVVCHIVINWILRHFLCIPAHTETTGWEL